MQINWTPRDLQVFLVLAETGSFRQTAARVHLSQSAVSGVIADLGERAALVRNFSYVEARKLNEEYRLAHGGAAAAGGWAMASRSGACGAGGPG